MSPDCVLGEYTRRCLPGHPTCPKVILAAARIRAPALRSCFLSSKLTPPMGRKHYHRGITSPSPLGMVKIKCGQEEPSSPHPPVPPRQSHKCQHCLLWICGGRPESIPFPQAFSHPKLELPGASPAYLSGQPHPNLSPNLWHSGCSPRLSHTAFLKCCLSQ